MILLTNRLLKKSFLSEKLCQNPNDLEGPFFKTCLFQQPVKGKVPAKPPCPHRKTAAEAIRKVSLLPPAESTGDGPINEKGFADYVSCRKVAPSPRIVTVYSIVTHHHVVAGGYEVGC